MIIDCIADLHGHYPKLDGGDLLIVAGDLTARHNIREYHKFGEWLLLQKYRKKVIIAGNHDEFFRDVPQQFTDLFGVDYLCDSGTEFEGLKIWGSPWTLSFDGINPRCAAFTGTEEELAAKFALIPDDIDILVTHSPPYGILDQLNKQVARGMKDEHVGSASLSAYVDNMKNPPKLWVFGHIHEGYGEKEIIAGNAFSNGNHLIKCVNCSHVNEYYQPVNKPIRVIL